MILGVSEKKDMSEACARFISWTQFGPLGLFGPLNAKQNLFCMILSLPFASNPWIFGGFESPVQLKGVCSIFVALDSSLPLGKRNNAASRAQKKKPLMAENRVSPHHPQQNIDRNDWFVVGVVTPPQLSILYRC